MRAGALLAALLWACGAHACPEPAPDILFHSCWGTARASLVLLPDEAPPPRPPGSQQLIVTGVYTGTDDRTNGAPNPVGLFIDGGAVVNASLARMDGILVINPAGGLTLHHRRRVLQNGRTVDLTNPTARAAFARDAAARRHSVAQSHLLVVDGRLDVRDRSNAPHFLRRLVFVDAHGFGVWQSEAPLTLYDAGRAVVSRLAPRMALNLDMGSYDRCSFRSDEGKRDCARVLRRAVSDFSNLLVLTWR